MLVTQFQRTELLKCLTRMDYCRIWMEWQVKNGEVIVRVVMQNLFARECCFSLDGHTLEFEGHENVRI